MKIRQIFSSVIPTKVPILRSGELRGIDMGSRRKLYVPMCLYVVPTWSGPSGIAAGDLAP